MTSFVAYIDESGDEGFRFLPKEAGSSRWFVLSAVVFRKENDLDCVQLLKDVRATINKEPRKALHFRDLKHEHRIPYVRAIGAARLRIVSVMIYKPALKNIEHFQRDSHKLYRYATRLLMERVSWVCKEHAKPGVGDGTADLVFSNRSAMSYAELRAYLTFLKEGPPSSTCHIDWGSITPANVRAVNHDKLAGLQIADAVASGIYFALNLNQYGESEPRYFELIASRLYRHKKSPIGYGLKFWPNFDDLTKTLDHLAMIERFV
jgi:hypothetical protein